MIFHAVFLLPTNFYKFLDFREDEVDLREQDLPLGELFAGQALEAELLGLEVHAEEDAEEVQECGQNCTHDDISIGNEMCIRDRYQPFSNKNSDCFLILT